MYESMSISEIVFLTFLFFQNNLDNSFRIAIPKDIILRSTHLAWMEYLLLDTIYITFILHVSTFRMILQSTPENFLQKL